MRYLFIFLLSIKIIQAATPPPGSTLYDLHYADTPRQPPVTLDVHLTHWKTLDLPLRQVLLLPKDVQGVVAQQIQQTRQIAGIEQQAQKIFLSHLANLNGIIARNTALRDSAMALIGDGDRATKQIYWDRLLKIWTLEPLGLTALREQLSQIVQPIPLPPINAKSLNAPISQKNYDSSAKIKRIDIYKDIVTEAPTSIEAAYTTYVWQSWFSTNRDTYWVGSRIWQNQRIGVDLPMTTNAARMRLMQSPDPLWDKSNAPIEQEPLPVVGVWGDLTAEWFDLNSVSLEQIAKSNFAEHGIKRGLIIVINGTQPATRTATQYGTWPILSEQLQPLFLLHHPLGSVKLADWSAFLTYVTLKNNKGDTFVSAIRKLHGVDYTAFAQTPQFFGLSALFDNTLVGAKELKELVESPESTIAKQLAKLWVGQQLRELVPQCKLFSTSTYQFEVQP